MYIGLYWSVYRAIIKGILGYIRVSIMAILVYFKGYIEMFIRAILEY